MNSTLTPATAAVVVSLATSAFAQPVPLDQKIGGVYVGDLSLDRIYLTRDLNGDGDALDAGEATVFFDETNASGLASPTGSVFTIFQAADRSVYFGDGGSDAVYRLLDLNNDRDAQDAGEATVWLSAAGSGLDLATPNGAWQTDDGAVYILSAGTSSLDDALYRTVDMNGDGDAEDAGEAALWFDTQTLIATSSAFELVFIGDVAYFTDTVGGDPDVIYRARDADASGSIDPGEFAVFIDDTNPYGVDVGTGLATDGTSLYASESIVTADQSVYRLTDLDASGAIDDLTEVEEVWNEALVPVGFEMGSSFGLAIGPGGELAVGSAGSDADDNVFRLVDGNGDGRFFDDGETIVWADAGGGGGVFIDNPRALEYALPRIGDANGDDIVGFDDLLLVLSSWGPCPGCPADITGDGTVGFDDLLAVLSNWS